MKKTYSCFMKWPCPKGTGAGSGFAFAVILVALANAPANSATADKKHNNTLSGHISALNFPISGVVIADTRITGKVTDAAGQALIGATISIKNGKGQAVTDVNGNFSLSVPDNATLVVSYIGYQTQEIAVAGKTQITIILKESAGNLNEVVVVGYTTQRKKDLTGAVSLVSNKDINGLPVGGVDQILQGKAAGVAVTQNTGAPGDGINIRIRGVGTINNNDPLYIVDGVPTTTGINEISPNDIESINILKDASSAAIYGARASNGVVLVTTKRGVSGKAKLNVSAYTGVQTAQHLIKMANNAQYVSAFNAAAANDGRAKISDSLARTLSDVNWLKEILKPARVSNGSLSINGGNENSQYIVSANYFSQNGLIKNSSFNRFNLRTAVNSNVTKYLRLGTNVNLSYAKTRVVGTSGDGYSGAAASIVRYALFRTPGTPVYNENGQLVDLPKQSATVNGNFLGDGINPVALAQYSNNNNYNYSVLGDAFMEITPVKGLKLKSDIGLNLILTDYKQFFETFGIDRFFNSPNSLAQSHNNNLNYNWTNTATYDLTLGKNVINVLAGSELIKQDQQGISASRTGFINQTPTFQYLDNGTLSTALNGGGESHMALFSLFGSLHYQYDNKYLASISYRRDGSSQLDPSNRYQSFTSGSLGWRIDQEDFMKGIKPISTLKLRASIGQLGNASIGTYPYTSTFGNGFYYPFGDVTNQGYSITTKGNPKIRWESSTQQDAGLDIGFFDNALLLGADYYIKKTSNMLLFLPLPSSAGNGGNPAVNAGNVSNKGLELELTYKKTINANWSFSVSGNFATVNNKVTALANGTPIAAGRIDNNYYGTLTAVGHPIGEFYLLQQEGIFQNAQQVFTHAYQGPGIRPGDVMYKDVNGDGVIDDKDKTFVGSPIPKFTYGLTANVSYRDFDLSLFFQGVHGNKIYNQVLTDIEGFYRPFNITERAATQSWTGEGSTNKFPLLSWSDGNNNKMPSTRFLESGSYMKLKNVQLGYRLSKGALSSLGLSAVRVYASAQNLLTFTKYTGLDPEQYNNSNNGNTVTAVGIDWGTYPSARTITFGINANF
ncbi:TonB-dependent receptor [Mucilaginibacter sp. CAU 1740]|uniref:SusC/RagA family TonB-linked outer membrane protein n=1 Tax=Mucilaginibacter sp. CAU 1740 TaxID=3140365 RepID=UPI00325AB808